MGLNPQRDRFMEDAGMGEQRPEDKGQEGAGGGSHPHSISIHHAAAGEPRRENPHHVHIHHADGSHEHSDHASYDEAMNHVNSSCGSGGGEAGGAGSVA